MIKTMKKLVLCCMIVLLCGITMSGCAEEENRVIMFAKTNLRQAANDRVTENLNRLNQLHESGWISTQAYNDAKKSIEKARKDIEALANKIDVDSSDSGADIRKILDSPLMKAVSYLHPLTEADGVQIEVHVEIGEYEATLHPTLHGDYGEYHIPTDWSKSVRSRIEDYYTSVEGTTPEEQAEHIAHMRSSLEINVASNFMKYHAYEQNTVSETGFWDKVGTDDSVEPITIINTTTGDLLDEAFNAEVWILKPDLTVTSINGATSDKQSAAQVNGLASDYSIDGLAELVAQTFGNVQDGEITEAKIPSIQNYYKRATDQNGKVIKLFDKGNNANSAYSITGISKTNIGEPGTIEARNELGYDMWVNQFDKPIFTLRFREFLDENINKLQALLGNGGTKYYLITVRDSKGSVTKRAYLMEYPIYYVSGFTYDNGVITADTSKSNLSINFRTKSITKYYSYGDAAIQSYGKVVASIGGELYPTNGSLSPRQDGNASFIIRGGVNVPIAYKTVDNGNSSNVQTFLNGQEAQTAKIILRDYLEAVYAPDFVSDENLVAFGRKLRLVYDADNWVDSGNNEFKLTWNTTDNILKYVDMDGKDVDNMTQLNYTKLADLPALAKDEEVKQFPQLQQGYLDTVREAQNASGTKKISDLKVTTTHRLNTGSFPGPYIGNLTDYVGKYDLNDAGSDEGHSILMTDNQLFYAIALNTDLFETNLFSKWINSADVEGNSLEWWNKWLADNHYTYNIDHQELNDYLQGNYSYEIGQSGVLILDIDTIGHIRQDMIKENREQRNTLIRTIFVIMGWLLVALSTIIPLCWVFDTNVGLGVNLTEKITFGHYIPVKYSEDMPDVYDDDVRYMGFKQVLITSCVLIATGIILINVNVYDVVTWLIGIFGGLGTIIEKLLGR